MYFKAASTLICRSMASARGSIRKNPDVGFGVVGTYTLMWSPASRSATSPLGVPVTNAMVQLPARGYCTSTARRKACPFGASTVSLTCLTEL
ncbi:hypothetical protein D9M70_600710 [compost metagenome]